MNIFPNDLFNVGADCGRGLYYLVHQELLQDGRFAGVVEADDTNFVFWNDQKKTEISDMAKMILNLLPGCLKDKKLKY